MREREQQGDDENIRCQDEDIHGQAHAQEIGKAVAETVGADSIDPSAGILTTERQRDCVLRAENAVTEGEAALTAGLTFDAVGVMLDEAIAALCELSGERVSETIVDEVFSSFCVGK